mmetsp:Transcript_47071/g.86284  ORF Transcript_47071/g.86284 Transcript_47071/m.86284 type:complete len:272 (+) Transcript_47071:135-950(+)
MAGTAEEFLRERARTENRYDDIDVVFPNGIHPGARASRTWPGTYNGVITLKPESASEQQPGVGTFAVMAEEPPRHNFVMEAEQRRRIWPPAHKPVSRHQAPQAGNYPGQPVDRLASEQLPLMWNLPSAHRMYHYGPRQVWYSQEVPVPEHNYGVMVNAEFPMLPHHQNVEVVYDDWAIRNMRWRHIGSMVQREGFADELASWRKHHKAEWDLAYDTKPNYKIPDYHEIHKGRSVPLYDMLDENLEREILNEHEIRDLFGNPRSVQYETVRY